MDGASLGNAVRQWTLDGAGVLTVGCPAFCISRGGRPRAGCTHPRIDRVCRDARHAALGGSNRAALPVLLLFVRAAFRNELESESQGARSAEAELQRKQKELDEQRTQLQEVKDQLKQAKRKLFEQKESDKGPQGPGEGPRRGGAQRLHPAGADPRASWPHAITEIAAPEGGDASRAAAAAPQPAPAPVPAAAPVAAPQISAPAKEGESVVAAAVTVAPAAEPAADRGRAPLPRAERRGPREDGAAGAAGQQGAQPRRRSWRRSSSRVKGRTETQQRVYNADQERAGPGAGTSTRRWRSA